MYGPLGLFVSAGHPLRCPAEFSKSDPTSTESASEPTPKPASEETADESPDETERMAEAVPLLQQEYWVARWLLDRRRPLLLVRQERKE